MLVFLLFWILYCIAEGFDHAWYPAVNHLRATVRRCATGIVVLYALCGAGSDYVLYINTAILLASSFTVFFDIAYNLSKGQKWNYIGSTSDLDKLLRKKPIAAWGAKFGILALSMIVQFYNARYIVIANPLINTTWLF